MRPFVVYWNNIPSPYMVERFNALADRGGLEFEAWFNDRGDPERSWVVDERQWRFCHRYMPVSSFGGRRLHWPWPLLGRRPDVLVSLYAKPSFLAGWAIATLRRVKTGFWVEVTFDRWVKRRTAKELLKRWVFRKVDGIVTVGNDGRRFAEKYGVPTEHIYFAPHAIDVSHYMTGAARVGAQRDVVRCQLGLVGMTFLYVGRLWWGKGVNYLLDAFEIVQHQSSQPVSLLLVGDGAEEGELKQICAKRNLRNVVFVGFQQKCDLPRYYAVADAFVFPTLGDPYGLVVDEAMACSLPVISTDAAGEIRDRIEHGVNGYIVRAEDSGALVEPMLRIAENSTLRAQMGKISLGKIQGHTPEKWAADFEGIIKQLLRTSGV